MSVSAFLHSIALVQILKLPVLVFVVWAFDTETECWSLMEAKGDIPVPFLTWQWFICQQVVFITVLRFNTETLVLWKGDISLDFCWGYCYLIDLYLLLWTAFFLIFIHHNIETAHA